MDGQSRLLFAQVRLRMDLSKRNTVVADWAWAQLQRAVYAEKQVEQVRYVAAVSAALIEWHRGDLKRSWFKRELAKTPPLDGAPDGWVQRNGRRQGLQVIGLSLGLLSFGWLISGRRWSQN
jgi:hypothetical protein